MAATAASPKLMPHQKDEHDIWICKDCGWKYPNAKPSPKIRKNHKKHCPGKGGLVEAGGSSDEASDDEHHPPLKGTVAAESVSRDFDFTKEAGAAAVESVSRDFDLSSATKVEATPEERTVDTAVNGNGQAATGEVSTPIAEKKEEKPKVEPKPAALEVPAVAAGGLMPHQKDEHDIWTCKDCGWKYPNAKPSPKVRKHHKKQCGGKSSPTAAPTAAGASSDEASDDDHHSLHAGSPAPKATTPVASLPTEPEVPIVESTPRSFDFAAMNAEPAAEVENPAVGANGTVESITDKEVPAIVEKIEGEAENPGVTNGTAEATTDKGVPSIVEKKEDEAGLVGPGGLMRHQKDEHDIWICKECGWKYPNARPSPKIRKNHKKQCKGKGGAHVAEAAAGGSSDEASDEEHGHLSPPATAAIGAGLEAFDPNDAPESTSREFEFKSLHDSPGAELKDEGTSVETSVPTVETESQGLSATRELPSTETVEVEKAPPAIPEEKKEPIEPVATVIASPERLEVGGLMPHQKDESDIWICKDCGWKYPNSKPSPKIRKNHKKKCAGKPSEGAATGGGSSDESSDGEVVHTSLSPAAEVIPPVADEFKEPDVTPASDVSSVISVDRSFAAPSATSNLEEVEVVHPSLSSAAEAIPPAVQAKEPDVAPASDVPNVISVDRSFEAPSATSTLEEVEERNLKNVEKSSNTEVGEKETPTALKTTQSDTDVDLSNKAVEDSSRPQSTGDISTGTLSLKEALEKETQGEKEPTKTVSLQEAMEKEALLEKELLSQSDLKGTAVVAEQVPTKEEEATTQSVTAAEMSGQSVSLESTIQTSNRGIETGSGKEDPSKSTVSKDVAAGGLLPHQKDEKDIWLCAECGWRYPNAKPSAKIRKNHKKKCPGKAGASKSKNTGSSDDVSSDDDRGKEHF